VPCARLAKSELPAVARGHGHFSARSVPRGGAPRAVAGTHNLPVGRTSPSRTSPSPTSPLTPRRLLGSVARNHPAGFSRGASV